MMTWLLATIISALILASLWVWIADEHEEQSENSNNAFKAIQSCLATTTTKKGDPHPLIISIGTSLLSSGTEPTEVFAGTLLDFRWQPCFIPAGSWFGIERALPLLSTHRPAVLLLHEGELVGIIDRQAQFFSIVNFKLRAALGLNLPTSQTPSARPPCSSGAPGAPSAYAVSLTPDSVVFASAAKWILNLQASGTRVVLLDIPRSLELESRLRHVLEQRRLALKQLAIGSGAQYWRFESPSSPQAYCPDQAHMDRVGRDQFAAQLAQRLQSAFAETSR